MTTTSTFDVARASGDTLDEKAAAAALDDFVVAVNVPEGDWKPAYERFLAAVPERAPLRYRNIDAVRSTLSLLDKHKADKPAVMMLLSGMVRFLHSPTLYQNVQACDVAPMMALLALPDKDILLATLRALGFFVQAPPELRLGRTIKVVELANRESFTKAFGFQAMMKVILAFSRVPDAVTVLQRVLEVATQLLVHGSGNTEYRDIVSGVEVFTPYIQRFFEMTRHKDLEHVGLLSLRLIGCILDNASQAAHPRIQNAALKSGAFLWIFQLAVKRVTGGMSQPEREQVALARDVFGQLCDNNPLAMSAFKRIVPPGMTANLNPKVTAQESLVLGGDVQVVKNRPRRSSTWGRKRKDSLGAAAARSAKQQQQDQQLHRVFVRANWPELFAVFEQDSVTETLIWNHITREELRAKIADEIASLDALRAATPPGQEMPVWDYAGFEVYYETLRGELKVGPYYVRKLIPMLAAHPPIRLADPKLLIRDLYEASVVNDEPQRKMDLLLAMRLVLNLHHPVAHAALPIPYLIWMLRSTRDLKLRLEYQPTILDMLETSLRYADDAQVFVAEGGVPVLIDRLVEARDAEQPIDASKISAEGKRRDSAQLTLLILLEILCANFRARQALTDQRKPYFQYLVQSLVSPNFDISSKAMQVISSLLATYPQIHSHLYKTGIFHFIMAGLDRGCTLTMAKFLKTYHRRQAFQPDAPKAVVAPSFLAAFLPEKMITLLDESEPRDWGATIQSKYKSVWNREKLKFMAKHVRSGMADYLAKPSSAMFVYSKPEPISYQ